MQCPNCGFENPRDMLFCGMCGTQISRECPVCQSVVPLGFRFCGRCGSRLVEEEDDEQVVEIPMPELVLAPEPEQESFPLVASARLPDLPLHSPLAGERRLATIIVSDVKESTKLMERLGTEEWVAVMNKALQLMAAEVYRFGGEVDQFRGDGLLAFFGARSAHEDDPERAVLAGLMMQLAMDKLSAELQESKGVELLIRVGINTGEVIAGNIGNLNHHNEDTAMGGAISLAARLESAAEPGTILVSEDTYRLTELQFKWESLGEMSVRGISRPLAVYRPLAPLSEAEQEHRLQEYGLSIPLIGREHELQQLRTVIQDLRNGVGGIVLLSGVAGLGKSRLVTEVEQSIKREEALFQDGEQRIIWLQGRSRSYGHSTPHSMWIDVILRWLDLGAWVSQDELLDGLQKKSQELWGDAYTEYYPYLAKFLSLPVEKTFLDWMGHLEAEGLRHQFFVAIQKWVEAMAHRGPLVIVFSEAHWVDEASMALFRHCLPLCENHQVLWMVVYRPDPTALTWQFSHDVATNFTHRLTTIELGPLDESGSEELLSRLIGSDVLPDRLQDEIIEKAEGNPYYLTEIVRSLVDREILIRGSDNGHWEITQSDASLDLPNSLINLLASRITRLSPAEQRILQLAAVIGTVFWSKVLRVLVDADTPIESYLTSLQRVRLIRERGCLSDLGTEYVFISALIRDAAYESLLAAQRVNYHLLIADFLEQLVSENILQQYHGMVAYHYRQANNCNKELFHTLLAAENAQQVYANSDAIREYSHALDLLASYDDCDNPLTQQVLNQWHLEALTGLGKIYFGIGDVVQAEKYLRAAITLGRQTGVDAFTLTHLFYWLGEVLFWQNRYEEPVHLGEEGLYYLGDNNRNVEAALMNQLIAIGCSQLGDHEKFIDFTQRTASFIKELSYTEELRPAYDHIIGLYAYTLKDIPTAEYWLNTFENLAKKNHDLRAMGEVYNHRATMARRQGSLEFAIQHYGYALEQFTRIGDDKHTCRSLRALGVCHLQTGQLKQAEENICLSLEKAEVIENEVDLALGYWFQAQILLCQGKPRKAKTFFVKAQQIARGVPALVDGWAFMGLGQVHFSLANAQEIVGNFKSILENDADLVFRNPYQTANVLSKLERSFAEPEDFRAYADQFRQSHPNLFHASFAQWYLTPGEINLSDEPPQCLDTFEGSLSDCWQWINPLEDCSYSLEQGLIIRAANEHNLHHINRSAPRMIREKPLMGDFAIQTVCQPVSDDQPGIGGLIVWQNEKNWLCFEVGARGKDEIIFRGFKDNNDQVFGRGILSADQTYLRLEKHGYQITAFCSADGETWFSAGGVGFPFNEPLYLGLHAIGHINRLIYPGAFPEGTALRFKELSLWEKE